MFANVLFEVGWTGAGHIFPVIADHLQIPQSLLGLQVGIE
jgi:hypothetical protein